jgi:hypothetical protein
MSSLIIRKRLLDGEDSSTKVHGQGNDAATNVHNFNCTSVKHLPPSLKYQVPG